MATAIETTSSTGASTTMTIQIYDTLSKRKLEFVPVEPGKVSIYLCGPTVYKEAHIGHMVGPVIFDTIKRYLTYCGFEVTWVVNITDVDDKLIAQSIERGVPMSQIATEMTMDYCANLLSLGVDQISHLPRATDNMDEIISFIEQLISQDFAYTSDGDVFFDVGKNSQYGKLSNRRPEEQEGGGGEAAAKKRSPGDFALWKSAKAGEPSWDSPWGGGRPGWHIECSAMSRRLLGKTFDIHGGGLDLVFPHHENEIAQSECCHGEAMAKYWMHNGLLRAGAAGKVGGRSDDARKSKKMSRSEGAGGLRDLIGKQGGERIRFFLLRTHYRSTVVFDDQALEEAATSLDKFYTFFARYERITEGSFYVSARQQQQAAKTRISGELPADVSGLLEEVRNLRASFLGKMDDDFNTGAAVSDLFQLLTALNKFADAQQLENATERAATDVESFVRGAATLRELSNILGLFVKPPAVVAADDGANTLADGLVGLLVDLRNQARKSKDFQTADRIRDSLNDLKVTVEDRGGETTWRVG